MDEGNKVNFEDSGNIIDCASMGTREPSMTSLLVWNISKARENNPSIDLKTALKNVHERLNEDTRNYNSIISLHPEDRHLACALLAWQELGHDTADSLYEFLETRKILNSNEQLRYRECLCCPNTTCVQVDAGINNTSADFKADGNLKYDSSNELKDNSNKIIPNRVKKAECQYEYILTPKNQEIVGVIDASSTHSNVEKNMQYTLPYREGNDVNDDNDAIIHSNVKNPTCPYDYIMTPQNQIVNDINDNFTFSQYKTEGNLQYDNKGNNLKDYSDKTISNNVKKVECRYEYIMTPRNQVVVDINDSASSHYKTEENKQYTYDKGKNINNENDKRNHYNIKKPMCHYEYIMNPRNQIVTGINDSNFTQYKTEEHSQHMYDKGKDTKDSSIKITHKNVLKPICRYDYIMTPRYQKGDNNIKSDNFDRRLLNGPVVNLPTETNIIMRSENIQNVCRHKRKPKLEDANKKILSKKIMGKIDAACCIDSACTEQLIELDKTIAELRTRADQLYHREAERIELIERAEAAWKDLELGYQRRINLYREKEEDIAKHVNKLVEDRNSYKEACMNLTTSLKEKGEAAEKGRTNLMALEKEICDCASMRLRLSQEFTSGDATLVEHHIKAAQLDRDFQLKEDQARRNSSSIESEVEVAQALAHEVERALRSELSSLKEQFKLQSEQLLGEESENCKVKAELLDFQQEKSDMIEDMENCQVMCDGHIQDKLDELQKKREQLSQLKATVIECKCKLPVDEAIEVKRTPSLATLCKCVPEDNILEQCSCTSLRGQLLNNLFADLFSGLQAELGGSGSMMPCQLLKCLEDKHNWDRSSVVKNNLRRFFSQLLLGELDIAIATSIEKYHATWIGGICAETKKGIDGYESYNEDQSTIERRAQKLANELAEQLFNERAEDLFQRTKDIISSSLPFCDCKQQTAAMYPCLVQQPTISGRRPISTDESHSHWRKSSHEVRQIRAQIDDLKKDTIKKEDLIFMEDKFTKLFELSKVPEPTSIAVSNIEKEKRNNTVEDSNQKESKHHRHKNIEPTKLSHSQKLNSLKKKVNNCCKKKTSLNVSDQVEKPSKLYKNLGHTYAVNVCLCGVQNESTKSPNQEKSIHDPLLDHECKTSSGQNKSKMFVHDMTANMNQAKPISVQMPSMTGINIKQNKGLIDKSCMSNYPCFHKMPSNSSIYRLLDFLAKWKGDLENDNNEQNLSFIIKSSLSNELNPDMKSKNKFGIDTTNIGSPNPSKDLEVKKILPITESDYIGAINLDKSNDCLSNSAKKIVNNYNSTNEENIQNHNLLFQPSYIKCAKSLDNEKGQLNDKGFSETHSNLCKNDRHIEQIQNNSQKTFSNLQVQNNKLSLPRVGVENNVTQFIQNNINNEENAIDSDIHHIVNDPETFPSDCCIKFLGVTLTNTNFSKVLDKNKNDFNTINNLEHVKEPITKHRNCPETEKDIYNATNISNPPITTCRYEINFDELQKILDKTFRKSEVSYEESIEKGLDVQNIKDSLVDIQGNCVCCNTVLSLDESQDLEVNTFNLLKDHLTRRLQKFKSYCCKSCISSDEEEKMFVSLLQKVKQVISDSTKKITCIDEEQTECSWNRAHSLLQEYLKMKINRIRSATEERIQDRHNLRNILDKVYNLIEDDFERLKTICKCHCTNTRLILNEQEDKQVPEKDINIVNNNSQFFNKSVTIQNKMGNITTVNKVSSNKSLILVQNISAQVPNNLGMETKSCDAMEKTNKNIQTTESTKSTSNKCCSYFGSEYDCGYNLNTRSNTTLCNRCINEQRANKISKLCYPVLNGIKCDDSSKIHKNISMDNDRKVQTFHENPTSENNYDKAMHKHQTSPYIGYTVDCSYNGSQGIDACIKSTIIPNNEQITNILKKTLEKARSQNISYIMDSVPKINRIKFNTNDKLFIDDTENNINSSVKNGRDSRISVQDEEEYLLKESNINLNISCNTTNTSDPMTNLDNDSVVVAVIKNTIDEYKPKNLQQIHKKNMLKQYHSILKENSVKSEPFLHSATEFSYINLSGCDCSMVPVCHVKMLVQNIENKLLYSKCTCDSLNPKICPEHSN